MQLSFNISGPRASISPARAATTLGVSEATVRNWVKAGILNRAHDGNRLSLLADDVDALHKKIQAGTFERLGKRANKTRSPTKRNHSELLSPAIKDWASLASDLDALQVGADEVLLHIAVEQVRQITGISLTELAERLNGATGSLPTSPLLDELHAWFSDLSIDIQRFISRHFAIAFPNVNDTDILGAVYQHQKCAGKKSTEGSYFTPADIVSKMVRKNCASGDFVLDPCCGSGAFLVETCKQSIERGEVRPLDRIVGFDIDSTAVRICRMNLLMCVGNAGTGIPNIFCVDALNLTSVSEHIKKCAPQGIDCVITNPPWGARYDTKQAVQYASEFKEIQSGESFSYFLALSLRVLRAGGKLSYLVPESFLSVKQHRDVRMFLIKNSSLIGIHDLGHIFSGLMTNIVWVEAINMEADSLHKVLTTGPNNSSNILQKELIQSESCNIIIGRDDADQDVIRALNEIECWSLRGNADWALGIVTGNNKELLHTEQGESLEPIYKGKDVNYYSLSNPDTYIRYERDRFQQCAKDHLYRAREKLIYRFISDRLVFAYDNQQRLTLNSANILIPRLPCDIKYVMAILNSSLSQFVFRVNHRSIKVLRSHLESLPIPILPIEQQRNLIVAVEHLIVRKASQQSLQEAISQIDEIILSNLPISKKFQDRIRASRTN